MDAAKPLLVRKIEQIDRCTFGIEWTDGHHGQWRLSSLRRVCPCAGCVDEWTHQPILKPEDVDDDIMALGIDSVGRYALNIRFTDGHNSGIYAFTSLRELCECGECKAGAGD